MSKISQSHQYSTWLTRRVVTMMPLKHLGASTVSSSTVKLDLKMIFFWAKTQCWTNVNAPPSHLPAYPWSSNDIQEGTSTGGYSPESRVLQMCSVISNLASWPPTEGGQRGQEWSDPSITLPQLDLDIFLAWIRNWKRRMISYSYTSPSCPPHPPPSYTEAQSEGGVTVKVNLI